MEQKLQQNVYIK